MIIIIHFYMTCWINDFECWDHFRIDLKRNQNRFIVASLIASQF